MCKNLLLWAVAAGVIFPAGLNAQNNTAILNHNSTEAVSTVLAHQQVLQLDSAQLHQLNELQAKLEREQTRLVFAGWRGAPGKNATPRFARERIAARPDHYVQTRMTARIIAFDRVPGKAVPRIRRGRVTRLVESPCPFGFLTSTQLELVHGFLTRV
jgi:hypothetical protein